MKGLLLKDWYMVLRYWKSMFVFNILYAIIASMSKSSMAVTFAFLNIVLGTMVVKSLMAYEEQNKWDSLAISLPVTGEQLVLEKYLVGFLGALITSIITAVIMSLAGIFLKKNIGFPLWQTLMMFVAAGMLLISFELPVLFKFGVNKGRIWFLAAVALVAGIGGGIGGLLGEILENNPKVPAWLRGSVVPGIMIAIILGAAAIFISVRLSVRFYKKREF